MLKVKKFKSALFLLLCAMGLTAPCEEVYWTPENLPMVHLQDARRYVCNPDGVLSAATVDSLDRELALLERETGVQTVVVVVRHIEGDDPYSFGQALADRYGIGHKGRDDGLIVLLCSEDRSYSILTGDGMEGVLPDVVCHRVEQEVMVPLLKEGRWDEAMTATLHTLDRCIRQDPEFSAYAEEAEEGWLGGLIAFGGMLVALLSIFIWGRPRCPNCHSRKLKYVQTQNISVNGIRKRRMVYQCKKCGHITHRDHNDTVVTGGGFPGGYVGGGRSHGGSFGGGSFGGGHFGGGGASGRF